VLVCDTGGPGAGLSAYAGVESERSLPELAGAAPAEGARAAGLYAEPIPGLRLIGSGPRLAEPEVGDDAVTGLFDQARQAHALTVVDCGQLTDRPSRVALELATHVAWVVPATVGGAVRAERVLAVVDTDPRGEILVARVAGDPPVPTDALIRIADGRQAPLVLMPHVPDLVEVALERALDLAQVPLEGVRTLLRR
jgi:hypothetical protein